MKDFRFWSKYLTHQDVADVRYYLDNYDGLVYQTNFLDQVSYLVPDMKKSSHVEYDHDKKVLFEVTDKDYHAICPFFTYYKEGTCYKEPVNKINVNVFPFWDASEEDLIWLLTVEHSQFITKEVVERLHIQFNTNDETINMYLKD